MNQSWHKSPVTYLYSLKKLTVKLYFNLKQSTSIFKEQDVCVLKLECGVCFAGPADNLSRDKSAQSHRVC